jgi:hypothetical protein
LRDVTERVLDEEALDFAISRVESFARLNFRREQSEKLEAVDILWSSFGIDDNIKERLSEWLNEFLGEDPDRHGAVLLGLLVGLFIEDYNA